MTDEKEKVTPIFDCGDMENFDPCPVFPQPTLRFYYDLDEYLDTIGETTLNLNNIYQAGNYRLDTTKHTYLSLPPGFSGKLTMQVGGYDPIHRSLTFQAMKIHNSNTLMMRTQKLENINIGCGTGDDTEDWTSWANLWSSENFNPTQYQPKGNYIENMGIADWVQFNSGIRTGGNAGIWNTNTGGALTFLTGKANINQALSVAGIGKFTGDLIAYASSLTRANDISVKFIEDRTTEAENMRDKIKALIDGTPAPTPKAPAVNDISVLDLYNRIVQLIYDYNNLLIQVQNGLFKIVDIPLRNRTGNIYDATDLDLSAYTGYNFAILKMPELEGGRNEYEHDLLFLNLPKSVDEYAYRKNIRHNMIDKQGYAGIGSMVYSIVDKKFSLLSGNGYAPMQKAGPGAITFLFYKTN